MLLLWTWLFSSQFTIAAELEIIIPNSLSGVKYDKTTDRKVTLSEFKKNIQIRPKKLTDTSDIESYMTNLFYIYKNKDIKSFLNVIDDKARQEYIRIPDEDKKSEWDTLSNVIEPTIKFCFFYNQGYIVHWEDIKLNLKRTLFLKKSNNTLLMSSFHASAKDDYFNDIIYYLTYSPITVDIITPIKKFNSIMDDDLSASFKLSETNSYLSIFKKEDKRWKLSVMLKDNDTENYRFSDLDKRVGHIKVKFKREHFTKNKTHELLILQTSYPTQSFRSNKFKPNWIIKVK